MADSQQQKPVRGFDEVTKVPGTIGQPGEGLPGFVPMIHPLDRPFTRRDMLRVLEAQLAYPGYPQRVFDALVGEWS